jgi:hypothetical protein
MSGNIGKPGDSPGPASLLWQSFFASAVVAAYLATQQRNLAVQRLADLCKSLDERPGAERFFQSGRG